MKKNILIALLMCLLIFSFASCAAKPELDWDEAENNLEDEDYEVEITDENLEVGMEESFYAITEDGDDYLIIVRYESKKYAKINYNMMKQEHEAEIEAIELEIKQIEYLLDEYSDDLDSDEEDSYKDDLKELRDELEELEEDCFFGIKGDCVWIATKGAIEDSKGK